MTPEEVAAEHWWWLMEQGWNPTRRMRDVDGRWARIRNEYELFEWLVRHSRELEARMTKAGPAGRTDNMGRPVHYDYANIRAWYGMGMSYRQIYDLCGASKNTILKALKDGGMTSRKGCNGTRAVSDAEREGIIAGYKSGVGSHTLAMCYRRSVSTICDIVRDAGIELRPTRGTCSTEAGAWGLVMLMTPEKRDERFAERIAATEEGGYHDVNLVDRDVGRPPPKRETWVWSQSSAA